MDKRSESNIPPSITEKTQVKVGNRKNASKTKRLALSSGSECNENNTLHPQPFNYFLALHRLFTYPLDFQEKYSVKPQLPAELGLWFNELERNHALLQCNFCEFSITPEKFVEVLSSGSSQVVINEMREKWDCNIACAGSKNVPMGPVDTMLNYKFEAHRLYSLLKKDNWSHVKPIDLAKSGFYYTEDGDNVRCAFCNLEVRGWEDGDTPDGEHRKWNPKCPFLCKQQSAINIPIGSEQSNLAHDGIAKNKIGANPFSVPDESLKKYGHHIKFVRENNVFLVTPKDLNIQEWTAPLHSKFATLSSRLESYKEFWPRGLTQTITAMARAGFFYTGKGDRAICFHCNLGLKDWELNDDPFIQHCKWNSSCQYLSMSKGPKFVEQVLRHNQNQQNNDHNSPAPMEEDNSNMACLKCNSRIVSKVNLPCGHMTHCSSCRESFCETCREEIISEIKVPGFSLSESE